MTKFLNISTDNTLGGSSASDVQVSSQKAVKDYVDGKIPTVNNPTITITQGGVTKGSFTLNQASGDTIALDAGGSGSVAIDNSTITKNGSDQLQAVATVNANTAVGATNPIYDWVGTLAEYTSQAVATNHPDWVCYITDDLTSGAYDAYSKSQTDALLANKVSVGHEVIEFQAPTAQNNHTWYRKYADGWIEQGARYETSSNIENITFPIPFIDVPDITTSSSSTTRTSYQDYQVDVFNLTTTGFTKQYLRAVGSGWGWHAFGLWKNV